VKAFAELLKMECVLRRTGQVGLVTDAKVNGVGEGPAMCPVLPKGEFSLFSLSTRGISFGSIKQIH
jgi:hypothetical protein